MIRIKGLGLMIVCVLGIVLNGCTVNEEYITRKYVTEDYITVTVNETINVTEEHITLNVTNEEYITINPVTEIVHESPHNAVVVPIGDWNMDNDTDATRHVQTWIDRHDIILCQVVIIDDYGLDTFVVDSSDKLAMEVKWFGGVVFIKRGIYSYFNNYQFSKLNYNRGWVVVFTSKQIPPLPNVPNARIFNK